MDAEAGDPGPIPGDRRRPALPPVSTAENQFCCQPSGRSTAATRAGRVDGGVVVHHADPQRQQIPWPQHDAIDDAAEEIVAADVGRRRRLLQRAQTGIRRVGRKIQAFERERVAGRQIDVHARERRDADRAGGRLADWMSSRRAPERARSSVRRDVKNRAFEPSRPLA